MKRFLVALMVLAVAAGTVGLFAAPKATNDGKVLTIYVWNDEFQTRFKDYFEKAGLVPKGVTVNWVVTPNQDNAYQNKLDEALLAQDKASANDKIDIFLVEADYALKYVNTPSTLDVIKDVGLTKSDVSQMYKYTKDIMTDSSGVLKGVSWQACPGGFIYRRSIAKAVIGSDDPAKVQAALSSWDKFDAMAAKAKSMGYFMVSGYDDDFRVFSDNMKSAWVDKAGKIVIDPSIMKWIDQTKTYTDKGYNNKASLWSAESWKGAAKDGKVMTYFGPGWFIDFCLAPATKADSKGPDAPGNGSYGDWAFCKGPQGFSWGGTWLCAAAGTDNIDLVKAVMKKLTCDTETLTKIAKEKGDFTNNAAAMAAVAKSDYKNAFLGGQNHVAFFLDSAKSINRGNMSIYDQGMTEEIQKAAKDYFDGKVAKDKLYDNFYTAILEKYPNLKK
jgi:DNA-binding transcriptional regulator/RsmH inhibitor MraZ